MNILKTSALASILALGSFAANASFTGSDTLEVQLNTGSAIVVNFTDQQITFDDIVASDTIDAQTTVGITVSGTRAITCTFSETEGTDAANNAMAVIEGNANTAVTATDGISVILHDQTSNANGGYLNVKLDQCTNASNIVVNIDSVDNHCCAEATLSSSLNADATYKTNVITLAVAYDTSNAITSFS